MPRIKILSTKAKGIAVSALSADMDYYDSLPYRKKGPIDLDTFENLFHSKKLNKTKYEYAISSIKQLHPKFMGTLSELSKNQLDTLFEKELTFLKKLGTKTSTPFYIMNLLVNDCIRTIEGLGNAYKGKLSDSEYLDIMKLKKSSDISQNEMNKEMQVADIEKILKSPIYNLDIRAILYKAYGSRLKRSFEDYFMIGLNQKPHIIDRWNKADLVHQYLFLLRYFNENPVREALPESSEFPPKPTEVMETLVEFRKSRESISALYGKLCHILDIDKQS